MMNISTKKFIWDKATKIFVAEMSDLGKDFEFEQIYPNDATNVGLVLVSARTQKPMLMLLVDTLKDADDDIVCWKLEPANTENNGLCKMIIYND